MKRFLLSFAVALFFISCSTPQRIIYREASGRNIEPTQSAMITPMVADLKIITEQSVSNTIVYSDMPVTTAILGEIENYKRMAMLCTARKYNADTMVAALINVDTNDNGYLEITVTGYPARYVNFRSMSKDDLWISDFNTPAASNKKESKAPANLLPKLFNKNK